MGLKNKKTLNDVYKIIFLGAFIFSFIPLILGLFLNEKPFNYNK